MHVSVTSRTAMSPEQKRDAAQRIEALEPLALGPVLGAHVRVERDENPRIALPFHAEGEIDVNGRIVRARAVGDSTEQALHDLTAQLERQLRRTAERRFDRRSETGDGSHDGWRHGDLPAQRSDVFPRPAVEREVVRRKSFALEPMSPLQAAVDMVDLDHDFYLFRDAQTGADAVIHRLREDERMGLITPAGARPDADDRWLALEPDRFSEPVPLQTALQEMDAVEHRFLFFVDVDSGRGHLLYRRYDGHYGLVEPG